MTPRRRKGLLALLLSTLWLGGEARAQEVDPVRYAIVKAGYVLNLLRLTQWPDASFATQESPLVVQVAGEDAMTAYLEAIVRDERIGNRPIVVGRLALPERTSDGPLDAAQPFVDALRGAHLVFVAENALPHREPILETVAGRAVLTVSDVPAFATQWGGMIGLAVRAGTVSLEVNVQRMDESGVSLSSRVLRLASIVQE